MQSLTLLIHGESGVGKSWLAETAPGPRLMLDTEGRAVHLKHPKIWWDPRSEQLPAQFEDGSPITTDTTIVVNIRDYNEFARAYEWLASGQHYFQSVIIDSLTELQQRCLDNIAGIDKVTTPEWGDLLRQMEKLIRDFRDLRTHPIKPLPVLAVICGTEEKSGKFRPMLQGKLSMKLAYHFDTVGFLTKVYDPNTQSISRVLAIDEYGPFIAKDNTDDLRRAYGMSITDPNIEQMLYNMNGAA